MVNCIMYVITSVVFCSCLQACQLTQSGHHNFVCRYYQFIFCFNLVAEMNVFPFLRNGSSIFPSTLCYRLTKVSAYDRVVAYLCLFIQVHRLCSICIAQFSLKIDLPRQYWIDNHRFMYCTVLFWVCLRFCSFQTVLVQ